MGSDLFGWLGILSAVDVIDMPAKKKPTKKEEESSSDSSSDSDSSSSAEARPKKAAGKKATTAKAKPEAAAEKAEKPTEVASEEKEVKGDDKAKAATEEEKKPVFEPPPRPVFKHHDSAGDIKGAQDMEYCPTCGLPPDFCMYGPSWAKCKPWCMEHYPHYYPDLDGGSIDDAKKKAAQAVDKGKVKELPGGKKKREASPSIQIKKLSRGGRKCVTSVAGLELFNVKLDDAAKKFKKKFSCGCAVVKDANGGGDTVDIQGDFEEEVIDMCEADYKIPRSKVERLDDGVKRGGKKTH